MSNIENPNFENKNIDFKNEHLKVIEGKNLTDANGNFVFDLNDFLFKKNWFKGEAIIATPNISSSELEKLNQALDLCASNPNHILDLDVIIYNSLDQKNESFKLGQEYSGHRMFVYIYPKEFFKSDPKAKEIFDNKIVPTVGNFGRYYTNYAT